MESYGDPSCLMIIVELSLKILFASSAIVISHSLMVDSTGWEELDIIIKVVDCMKEKVPQN